MVKYVQLPLIETEAKKTNYQGQVIETNGLGNRLAPEDRVFHDWYRFVLSYPAHLVSYYMSNFGLKKGQVVLDPFCGTGTTLVEAKRNGINSIGVEANPIAHFASSVKVDWDVNPLHLTQIAQEVANQTLSILAAQGIDDNKKSDPSLLQGQLRTLSDEQERLILQDSISPLPLHKVLVLRDVLSTRQAERCYNHLCLALAKTIVFRVSNLHFGPEVGVEKPKADAPVIASWLGEVQHIVKDISKVYNKEHPTSTVLLADARNISQVIASLTIDAVITSPPYPNEKDYTRTTRLESVILGFVKNKEDLRHLKKTLVRSNTRGVYKEDDDDQWSHKYPQINEIARAIENRRIELGKTSGFERLYGRVTRLYFGGMARHLEDIRQTLHPGAQLAYVVGDQASYLRILIRTGQLLAEIATEIGYEVVRIDLFRTRFATSTKQELREEVVILKWRG